MSVLGRHQVLLLPPPPLQRDPAGRGAVQRRPGSTPRTRCSTRRRATRSTSATCALMRLAEELGFDGICINEHHNTVYSMTPTVSVMAGGDRDRHASARRSWSPACPSTSTYPNRVAEEYAMLDVMSGGRMEFAFPLGTGMEYWSNAGAINPATARARFRESLDVILQAWTEDGPTRYDGDFYTYRYLNPWPQAVPEAAPEVLHRRHGQRGDGRSSRSTTTSATRSSSCRSRTSSARSPACASSPTSAAETVDPGRPDHRRHGLRRRHGRGGGHGRPGRTSRSSSAGSIASRRSTSCRPATCRRRSSCAASRTPPWPRARGDLGRHGRDRPHRLRLARHGRRHDRAAGPRRQAAAASTSSRARRHAGVEDGQEHDAIRRRGHPKHPGQGSGGCRDGRAASSRRGGALTCRLPAKSASTSTGSTRRSSAPGEGDPLVFLHGAGTLTGFDALLPLAERFRLIVPHHPGFGASADDTTVDSIHDYVLHYLDLFDALGSARSRSSATPWAATSPPCSRSTQRTRVRRLVLAAPVRPAGARAPDDRLLQHPRRGVSRAPRGGHVDLRGARADAADPGVPRRALPGDDVSRRGSSGAGCTTSSSRSGCTA